jgi:hypothetical protein
MNKLPDPFAVDKYLIVLKDLLDQLLLPELYEIVGGYLDQFQSFYCHEGQKVQVKEMEESPKAWVHTIDDAFLDVTSIIPFYDSRVQEQCVAVCDRNCVRVFHATTLEQLYLFGSSHLGFGGGYLCLAAKFQEWLLVTRTSRIYCISATTLQEICDFGHEGWADDQFQQAGSSIWDENSNRLCGG